MLDSLVAIVHQSPPPAEVVDVLVAKVNVLARAEAAFIPCLLCQCISFLSN